MSLLYSIGKLGTHVRPTGAAVFETPHGQLRCDFACCVSTHPIGNYQQGMVIVQHIDQITVLVIFSVKTKVRYRLYLHLRSKSTIPAVANRVFFLICC